MVEDVDGASGGSASVLAEQHIEIAELERMTPSMEDVFVALIEQQERSPHEFPPDAGDVREGTAPHRSRFAQSGPGAGSAGVMLLLFGSALSLDVDQIPTIVYDADQTAGSRELVRQFAGSRFFKVRGTVDNNRAMERAIDRSRSPDGRGGSA